MLQIKQISGLTGQLASKAPLASPSFSGVPQAPTPTSTDSSNTICTTAFVHNLNYATDSSVVHLAGSETISGAKVFSVSPSVPTLTATDNSTSAASTAFVHALASSSNPVMNGTASPGSSVYFSRGDHVHGYDTSRAPIVSPSFTGNPTAPTVTYTDNSMSLATTAFVQSQYQLVASVYAPINSPNFTGTPTAPTPTSTDNSTKLATTQFIKNLGYLTGNQNITLTGDASGSGTTSIAVTLPTVNATTTEVGSSSVVPIITANAKGLVTSISSATITPAAIGAAPLNSPNLTGNPTAPTDAATDNSTSIATTAWVRLAIQGTQTLWVPSAAMIPRKGNGCSSLIKTEISAAQPNINSLNFDPTTQQYCQFSVAFPKSWDNGTIQYEIFWCHPATTTNFGVVFGLSGVAISPAQLIGTAFGTEVDTTSTGGTTYQMYTTGVSAALTIGSSPANGDVCWFQLTRVSANASDTLAVNAMLLGCKLYYKTNALNDGS